MIAHITFPTLNICLIVSQRLKYKSYLKTNKSYRRTLPVHLLLHTIYNLRGEHHTGNGCENTTCRRSSATSHRLGSSHTAYYNSHSSPANYPVRSAPPEDSRRSYYD
ncbi:hypothetical protein TorRG33x02_162990 [Trema orientale]|uniref:Uncharacterized protein n=1 Tax=Trema orientale TaxID=63057 RepID=A0A2P5EQU9_TREOI|nr:hypothetical protein TorRG33x02_162990 [Trema orientale]